MRRHAMIAVAIATSLAAAGCQTEDAYTGEKKTSNATKGALIGAAGGAAVGALTNKNQRGKNALIGAGIGAAAGGGIGYYMDRQEEELRKELRAAGVSVERRGDTIALNLQNDILFGVGSSTLSSRSEEVLRAVAIVLKKYDETRVNVHGFTDTTGTSARNEALSQQRAEAVAASLARNGVTSARLNTRGMGEKNLKVSTADNVAEARNRRVEIVLEPMNG
jgi:outer membrane protein OmpA-like peptidoglycan-associated protein